MSTLIYDQDFNHKINTAEKIADELEKAARRLREDGEVQVYLGGTVYANICLRKDDDEPGISISV